MNSFLHRLLHWEFWPFQVIYFPIYFQWAIYAWRSGSLFFFNATNPTMKNGGFMSESKKEIYEMIPAGLYPKTILITKGLRSAIAKMEEAGIAFPVIAKPDIGLRGGGVKKILDADELRAYSARADFDFLIQEFIPFPKEVGIFYVRHPHAQQGKITGIVAKEFLTVTGDGNSTIATLLNRNPRHKMQLKALRREYGDKLQDVLPANQQLNLVPYGNHARGARFLDRSDWISAKLTNTIDAFCLKIPNFYFGRIDIMYNSLEELENGQNFSIVELNGAGSEPTHIYDPAHSILFAWKELSRHIKLMYCIARENHRRGAPYLTFKEGIRQYQIHLQQTRKISRF